MTLRNAEVGKDYTVVSLNTNDSELNSFLFSLGCYDGETVSVIASRRSGMVITIKDARYSIDKHLADAIEVTEK